MHSEQRIMVAFQQRTSTQQPRIPNNLRILTDKETTKDFVTSLHCEHPK
jgi:hypothetical protein